MVQCKRCLLSWGSSYTSHQDGICSIEHNIIQLGLNVSTTWFLCSQVKLTIRIIKKQEELWQPFLKCQMEASTTELHASMYMMKSPSSSSKDRMNWNITGKVVSVLNYTPCHENIWGSECIAWQIFNFNTTWKELPLFIRQKDQWAPQPVFSGHKDDATETNSFI